MSENRSFLSELKRRNVVRAAGLYLVGAWLLTQVASTVLPMFGAPDWRMIFGENSRAISTLTRVLEIPYSSYLYGGPVTPALFRLDPTWDPLRADPRFQKLCEEKTK